jgi:hypothetical protein
MLAWSVAKHRPLEDILVDQGAIDAAGRDPVRSMADRIIDDPVRAVPNPDVIALLGHPPPVMGRHSGDPDARLRRVADPLDCYCESWS